jgi:hypothetical protein
MGLLVRTAVVVGIIYAISPVHETGRPGLAEQGRDIVRSQTERAAKAAADLCRRDKAGCLSFGLQSLGQASGAAPEAEHPSTTSSTRPHPAPLPAVAATGRLARP